MSKPNVVFIMTDQQRPDSLGFLGYDYARTPNLDRIAQNGVCLRNTYVQSTVCVPSRASFLSAKYIHQHGAVNNGTWIQDDETNWVHDFRNAGYHTAAIGKIHSKPVHHPCGFEYRWVAENKNHASTGDYEDDDYEILLREHGEERPANAYPRTVENWYDQLGATIWPLSDDLYPDNVVGDRTVDYISNHDFQTPLMMHVGFPGPHDPFDVTQTDLERFGDLPIEEPVGYEGEFNDKPRAQKGYMELMEKCTFGASIPLMSRGTPERIRRMRLHYYVNVAVLDEWVGKICSALEQKEQLENTIIVFTSDHGDTLGDHGMIYKFGSHYESVVRVPMLLAGPGLPDGVVREGLVETIDIGPTLLDLCQINTEQPFQGQSVMPLIADNRKVHDYVFSEYEQRLMVRSEEWKLVYYRGNGDGELYSLKDDPDELNNLYYDVVAEPIKSQLLEKLLSWRLQD